MHHGRGLLIGIRVNCPSKGFSKAFFAIAPGVRNLSARPQTNPLEICLVERGLDEALVAAALGMQPCRVL
jgi:hypothetical protein